MRESYFTPETLEARAVDMLQQIEPDRRKQAAELIPARSALLVLDVQRYFLEETSHAFIPSAPIILPGIRALADTYAARRLPIIFTRHINTPQNAGLMATWWRSLMTGDSPLSKVTPELDTLAGIVIPKSQYDAFYGTPLEDLLRERGVRQVVICGVMTHLCCETTARSAFVRGFEVFFTVDGTATYNEAFHRATLLNLSHGFATLVRASDILEWVQRA